jgi:hypothetical protein
MNQSNPKQNKGEYKEQNGRRRVEEDKKNHLREQTSKGMSSRQKEPSKRANHKGHVQVPEPHPY